MPTASELSAGVRVARSSVPILFLLMGMANRTRLDQGIRFDTAPVQEMEKVVGFEQRAPDMSEAAGAAFRAAPQHVERAALKAAWKRCLGCATGCLCGRLGGARF